MHSENFIKALESRYVAQKDHAFATLRLYFDSNRLSAIGEHSDILADHDKWLGVYLDATDKLNALREIKEIIQDTEKSGLIKS